MNTGFRPAPRHFEKSRVSLRSLALLVFVVLLSAPTFAQQLSASARKQISDVIAFKNSFTPAEKKMSSNLVLASRAARNMPLGSLAHLLDKSKIDSQGMIQVKIGADLSPSLMSSPVMSNILKTQGDLPQQAYASGRLQARISASQLLALASNSDVHFIREADQGTTNVGAVTSQGYVTHTANKAVALGVTGTGVTVGILSDSASPAEVAALIATGDLPSNVIVVPGQNGVNFGGENEGTAMMEIVHDMAPGANLVFATAYDSQEQFAANIRTLRFTYHCDIIADDFTYFAEGAFQDGTVAQAVNDVVADGAIYFSAAANSGNLTFGTSGTWEGDFHPNGDAGPLIDDFEGQPVTIHNFGTVAHPQNYDSVTATTSAGISLKWSDPLAAADDDYDLFILDSTGTVIKGASFATQDGTQDPFEFVGVGENCGTISQSGYCPAVGDEIVIVLYNGQTRAFHLDSNRGQVQIATDGSTYGHNAGMNTVGTAATYWNSGRKGAVPFTGPPNPIEVFSSDGPRKIFFNPDGTPITPGNFLFSTNGGTTLQKPDVTAADGVFTKTPGFLPFFGTSAATPHAAGIAALVKSANHSLTNAQIKSILITTTVDNMAPGVDRDSGYGIVMALPAVQKAKTTH